MTKVITSVKISNLLHIQHNVVHFKVFRNVWKCMEMLTLYDLIWKCVISYGISTRVKILYVRHTYIQEEKLDIPVTHCEMY